MSLGSEKKRTREQLGKMPQQEDDGSEEDWQDLWKSGTNDALIVTQRNKKPKLVETLPKPCYRKTTTRIEPDVTTLQQENEEKQHKLRSYLVTTARKYQIQVLDKAMQENTIVYLETGCGKTLIAVLLIKKLAHQFRNQNKKVVAVFLAPTVCLVEQQTEVLKINTDLKVDSFFGAKGVDHWSAELWQTELEKNEVLVLTPQVFLDALRHSFLDMSNVELLILDECHHTQKHHAYAKIMREYYHNDSLKKPKVFAMTASPVIRRGVSSMEDCAYQMEHLESILDSKVFTLKDRLELESFVPTPILRKEHYDKSIHHFESVKERLNVLREKYEKRYNCVKDNGNKQYFKDDKDLAKKLWKKVKELHGSLCYCLEHLGLWCAYEAANVLLLRDKRNPIFETDVEALQNTKENFLREALPILNAAGELEPVKSLEDAAHLVERGLLSPKVFLLVKCLLQYRGIKDMSCIVFVERVVAAMVLARIGSQIMCLSFFNYDFLSGTTASLDVMSKPQQQHTIEQFRSGKVNILIATNVAEEGLDVQSCSSVIRFDLPKSVRSFIQSRGRARRPGSDYVIFLERDNQKEEILVSNLVYSEESMRAQALNREHKTFHVKKDWLEETEFYRVESTGASVNIDSSINLIYFFCSKLPGDKYYLPQPEFNFLGDDNLHVCKLMLPPNAPFREIIGPPKKNRSLAKQVVCLEACRKLHLMGQLSDNLLPVIEVEKFVEEEVMNIGGKKVGGAGTRKRKELHLSAHTDALYGDWINKTETVALNAYTFTFTFYPKEEHTYSNFVFLVDFVIDEDVANIDVPLFLTRSRRAKATIRAAGSLSLERDQLKAAKAYHQFVYNAMFGKLLKRKKTKDESSPVFNMKNLLASQDVLGELWQSSHMYLFLPLILHKPVELNMIPVDWESINNCAVAANLFSTVSSTEGCQSDLKELRDPSDAFSQINGVAEDYVLCTACGYAPVSKLMGMVVVTVHTGKLYTVIDVLKEKTAECPMTFEDETKEVKYNSYAHYFETKYGKVLEFPRQYLLQVKQSHCLHNLLIRTTKHSKETVSKEMKRTGNVEMPPELCLLLGISGSVVRSLYLVPSVLHRFNALLLGAQLRHEIAKTMPRCGFIKASQVLEALTTLRCLEGFSFEGLELLGDSFLKYAVSRYLYLMYDKKHEGQLSARRSRAICNATLHKLALAKKLPQYVRDEPFHPGHWAAPGMVSQRSVVCRCNLNNLTCHLDENDDNEEKSTKEVFRIGKTCSKGHRWVCSKTLADTFEALVGAFLADGDARPALDFMTWMGMEVEFDLSLIEEARSHASLHQSILDGVDIAGLETQIGYSFQNKSIVVEALTHASQQDFSGGCYQRLEFLGDSVLDFLITRHLFSHHPGLTPGILSDLRSAAVNNECFARAAVKNGLQRYLRHGSGELLTQITSFVKAFHMALEEDGDQYVFGWEGIHGPKVLGDLVESIAGAVLVDSSFNLESVWGVMKPILSPIVTPETLPLHPIREVHELSQYKGFSFDWKKTGKEDNMFFVIAEVKLDDEVITKSASARDKKNAKKEAAQQILAVLREKGIVHPRLVSFQGPNKHVANTTNTRNE